MSQTTIKRLDPTQVELEIEISPAEFTAAQDAAFRQLVRSVKMPGFRPGKVPRKIFENAYGTAAIVDRALEDIVPEKYAAAVKEHAIEPVARPQMEMLPEEDGRPLRVKAVVSVRPEFEPAPYGEIELTAQPEAAAAEDLAAALARLQKEHATLVPAARPVRLGDTATIDYAGTIDGVPFEGGTATGQQVEVSEERFIPGFATGIAGMSAGETKEISVRFPDDYAAQDLAGKEAVFTITVHEVKEAEAPELDDEFAKRVSQHENLAALTADLQARLDAAAAQKARRALSSELLDKLVAANDFPLPQVMVDAEGDVLLDEARQYVGRMGLPWDEYLKTAEKTEEDLRAEFADEARRRVKTTLLIEEIAKREKIEAAPADIESELDALSRQYGQPRERILELLGRNLGSLVDGIVRTKTIDLLLERARRVPATKAD